ncbi:Uncharacterized protein Fot_49501 [Forsythia ovata]|uniref:Uncharacterized protein n=1 Tax=Forsythia ovata TaxID=205694 RepID=A0ABD1QC31_9LAMI
MASSSCGSKSRRKAKMRRNQSGSKRNRGKNSGTAKHEKKKVNIPVPEGQTTFNVDAHINFVKTIDNGSSHNIHFDNKSVEEEAAHHKSLSNNREHGNKTTQTTVNCSTNNCGGKLHKEV